MRHTLTGPQVRDLIVGLLKDSSLWQLPFPDAARQLLNVAVQHAGLSVASLWLRELGGSTNLRCVAAVDADQPGPSLDGLLIQGNSCPAYIAALSQHRVLPVNDVRQHPDCLELLESYFEPQGIASLLDATLRHKGELAGVLCLEQRGQRREWTETEIGFAADLVDLIGQLWLFSELRRRGELQALLLSIAPELGRDHSVEQLARLALSKLLLFYPGMRAAFFTYDAAAQCVDLVAYDGEGLEQVFTPERRRLPVAGTVSGAAIAAGHIVQIANFEQSNQARSATGKVAAGRGVRCAVGIPLIHDGQAIGTVTLWLRDRNALRDEDLEAFELIATTFSVALANAHHVSELRHRTLHDALTGLPNRHKLLLDLQDLMDQRKGAAPEQAQIVGLMLLKLRQLEQVHHALGRANGDRLVQLLADKAAAGAAALGCQTYRLSEDELAIVNPGHLAPGTVRQASERMQDALQEPVELGGLTLIMRTRAGFAQYPDHAQSAGELLRCADLALQKAVETQVRSALYSPEMQGAGPKSMELLADLSRALEGEELQLWLQPKLNLATGRLSGCEALLRWPHPLHGWISPERIVQVAENGDLIGRLTLWVARRAIGKLAHFSKAGLDISISINVSTHNLMDMQFPDKLQHLLTAHGVGAQQLRLEITETALMSDPGRAGEVVERLAALGLAVEVDDFGTGYSSMAYLRRLPLAAIKIDRTFVAEMVSSEEDRLITQAMIRLAHGLRLSVVAEGIEDEATAALLHEAGCDEGQGWLYGKAMPLPQFLAWAAARRLLQ
ncbi:EAL domain-containing protein [Pelomonas sp. V22]|uniref:sensor domain-containing phosphodiesterase n=1 Tax=Pelomonas sp. V22 TaxID=2822139 RepID=UPI0024A7AF1D|nr:EAL domain-containing protein [Pelomonas sp. V22]MDI4633554.1 EAL domain-containing protein [Pelomonas sp. V22]